MFKIYPIKYVVIFRSFFDCEQCNLRSYFVVALVVVVVLVLVGVQAFIDFCLILTKLDHI